MKVDEIKRILVLGAGTMGHQIGFLCAAHGYEVVIYDLSAKMLEQARNRIDKLADRFIQKDRLTSDMKKEAINRISFTDQAEEAAKNTDFVTESVPEDPKLKGEIFSKFNKLCPERTIFTTNTSTLLPSMFAEATGRPEKFLAFHFHDVSLSDIVDIMPHPGTSQETVDLVKAFAEKIGQIVIMLGKENFGYVFNAMLSEFLKSALALASEQIATVEDIDRAWMGVTNSPAGPFGMMDSVGLDIVWKIIDHYANTSKKPQLIASAAFLKEYLDNGKLGLKSGQGFYTYPDPLFKQPGFINREQK
ncbi:MAG: 3-hydroxyacyl-CoA dehydrogenase [Desulfobacteraceae bacterium]|nr:3-hydroxyacyl-CoA dehydrogenase [Desulfobacteraceae bacterium]